MSFGKDERRGIIVLATVAILVMGVSFFFRMCDGGKPEYFIEHSGNKEIAEDSISRETVLYRDTINISKSKSGRRKKGAGDNRAVGKKRSKNKNADRRHSSESASVGDVRYRDILGDTVRSK